MPFDKKGMHHLSMQKAMASDKMGSTKPKAMPAGEPPATKGGNSEDVNDGGVAQHLQNMHDADGEKHMHVTSHDDGSHTTHHISHEGIVEGPHHHPDMEALKSHMDGAIGGPDQDGNQERAMQGGVPAAVEHAGY